MIDKKNKTYNGIPLRPIEYNILKFFTENPNVIIPRKDIFKAVWGDGTSINHLAFDVQLCNIRKKIPDIKIKNRSKFGFIYEP